MPNCHRWGGDIPKDFDLKPTILWTHPIPTSPTGLTRSEEHNTMNTPITTWRLAHETQKNKDHITGINKERALWPPIQPHPIHLKRESKTSQFSGVPFKVSQSLLKLGSVNRDQQRPSEWRMEWGQRQWWRHWWLNWWWWGGGAENKITKCLWI